MSRSFIGFLIALSAACSPGSDVPVSEAYSVTDSAGVAIVESNRPVWGDGEEWTLSSEPEVVIGQTEGDEKYLLSEVVGVRRLSDGRIAVLESGSKTVRLYDSTGQHLMDLGGDGDGPGELRWPQFLGVRSDTLFVFEYVGGDVTWFAPDGELLRISNALSDPDVDLPGIVMFGYLDGRYGVGVRSARSESTAVGVVREPRPIWRFDLLQPGLDSLFADPGNEDMIITHDERGTLHRTYPFGKRTLLTAWKDQLVVAPDDDFSVQVFDGDGTLRRIVRRPGPPRRVTSSDFRRWGDEVIELLDLSPDEEAERRRSLNQLTYAGTMPAYVSVVVDADGNLWVEEWEGVGLEQGRFSVFRTDGAWLGNVTVPDGLHDLRAFYDRQLVEIGSNYFLGVWADDFGVEQVRLYGLEKE